MSPLQATVSIVWQQAEVPFGRGIPYPVRSDGFLFNKIIDSVHAGVYGVPRTNLFAAGA